jgi:hypothetical protein
MDITKDHLDTLKKPGSCNTGDPAKLMSKKRPEIKSIDDIISDLKAAQIIQSVVILDAQLQGQGSAVFLSEEQRITLEAVNRVMSNSADYLQFMKDSLAAFARKFNIDI